MHHVLHRGVRCFAQSQRRSIRLEQPIELRRVQGTPESALAERGDHAFGAGEVIGVERARDDALAQARRGEGFFGEFARRREVAFDLSRTHR
jgi:hypothetical protein